jgi:protein tyrosine phosphatase (PTP) superfamily phosphohydrolase (DUF442 family)
VGLRLTGGKLAALALVAGAAFLWRRFWGSLRGFLQEMTLELADRETPDVSWVADDLAIGGRILPDEWAAVQEAGVGAVVDCRSEGRDPESALAARGIALLHLPTVDSGNFTTQQVAEGVDWIEKRWAEGRRVLVHCQAGKGRSVVIGGAALTRRGMTPDEAVALIRERRPIITPTPGQLARLREFAAEYQLPLSLDT